MVLKSKPDRWREVKVSKLRLSIASLAWIAGLILLVWNEFEAVSVTKCITSMLGEMRLVTEADSIMANWSGLLYIHGRLQVDEPLTEPDYGLSLAAVRLKRRVQMYQWVEKIVDEREEGGFLIYRYETEWRDKLIDSSSFYLPEGHDNPKEFSVKSMTYLSPNVKVGAYSLSTALKEQFKDWTLITSDERPERHDIKMHAGLYYHSQDVWNPKVGDFRIQFSYAGSANQLVSIIANCHSGVLGDGPIILIQPGKVTPSEIIANAHNSSMWAVRIFRGLGWLILYLGCNLVSPIFFSFGRKVYLLVTLERRLSGSISASSAATLLAVSAVWALYRPAIAVFLLLLFLAPFFYCLLRYKEPYKNHYKCI